MSGSSNTKLALTSDQALEKSMELVQSCRRMHEDWGKELEWRLQNFVTAAPLSPWTEGFSVLTRVAPGDWELLVHFRTVGPTEAIS